MLIPDGEIDVLAQDMIKHFPADAAERAALRSKALFVLGYSEKSKKWLLVTEEIKTIQAGQAALQDGESRPVAAMAPEGNDARRASVLPPDFAPSFAVERAGRCGPNRKHGRSE